MIKKLATAFLVILTLLSCTKEENNSEPTVLIESIPTNNDQEVDVSTKVRLTFSENIQVIDNHEILLNEKPVEISIDEATLSIEAELQQNTEYRLTIPSTHVLNKLGEYIAERVVVQFRTKQQQVTGSSYAELMLFIEDMGVGWNLGNTLDAKGSDETAWGNPKATEDLIKAIADKGFKTLRVPTTWQYHMGAAPDYKIELAWLDRVEEVVNYGFENQMYVILDVHHDEEWLVPTYNEIDRVKDQASKVWTQIADRFKEYDNHLIFETLNETRLIGSDEEWSGGTPEGRDCINKIHSVCVEAIRNTGSENLTRNIMVSPYAASPAEVAMEDLELPNSNNLIVSIHNYYPYELCLGEKGIEWGSKDEKAALENEFNRIVNVFHKKEIPVIMGEWGNMNHDNLEHRITHIESYVEGCLKRGICPVWWDNGNFEEFGIINRSTNEWQFPEIADAIISTWKKFE